MAWGDLSGQVALVTGGTRGIGLACARALARRGAAVIVTYRWDEEAAAAAAAALSAEGGEAPLVVEADVARAEDTAALMAAIAARFARVDLFVCNAAATALGGDGLAGLGRRDFARSLERSAWPLLRYVEAIRERLGAPPRRVIAVSSDGPDHYYPGYDYVACSKAALEGLVEALADGAAGEGVIATVLRARQTWTESLESTFPAASLAALRGRFGGFTVQPEEVAGAVVALASGLLDGLQGRSLTVDHGSTAVDNFLFLAQSVAEWRA